MNNKRILLTGWFTACLLLLTVTAQAAQVSFGKPEKINEQWEFYPGDNPAENTNW
jgi:hypothetical protein